MTKKRSMKCLTNGAQTKVIRMMVRTTTTSKWVNVAMKMIWRKKSQGPARPQCRVETTNRQDDQREDHDQTLVRQRPDTRRQDNEHINTEPPRHRRHHSSSRSGTPAVSRASRNARTPRPESVESDDEAESLPPRAYAPLKRLRKVS